MKSLPPSTQAALLLALLASQGQAAPVQERGLDMGLDMGLNLAPEMIPAFPELALPSPTLPPLSLALPGASEIASLVQNIIPTPTPVPAAATPASLVSSTDSDGSIGSVEVLNNTPTQAFTNVVQALAAAAMSWFPSNLFGNKQTTSTPTAQLNSGPEHGGVPPPSGGWGASDFPHESEHKKGHEGLPPGVEAGSFQQAGGSFPQNIPHFMDQVTSVIGGVTTVLTIPGLPAPTPAPGLHLPQFNIPGIMGDQSTGLCIKDDRGNMIGWCDHSGNLLPTIKDQEHLGIHV